MTCWSLLNFFVLVCALRSAIKHFVANDQEHERTAAESVISERALRELYLYPYVKCSAHPYEMLTFL